MKVRLMLMPYLTLLLPGKTMSKIVFPAALPQLERLPLVTSLINIAEAISYFEKKDFT